MNVVSLLIFVPVLLVTLLVSGNATYEVLTYTVGISSAIALGAAIVIDAAAIWLGLHATILAKLGDKTTLVQAATWLVTAISIAVNFYHGWVAGALAGGLVGIIFPVLAAILFKFFIKHTIREALRSRGRILPEKPIYLKSGKYGDKARQQQIERDYASLTYALAEDNLRQQRDSIRTSKTKPEAVRQDKLEQSSEQQDNETEQQDIVLEQNRTPGQSSEQQDRTAEQQLEHQVNKAFAEQALQDISETMTLREAIEVLLELGIEDNKQIKEKLAEQNRTHSLDAIRTTKRRVLQDRTEQDN